ncbi:hypothetical protein V1460_33800 [Streptomyces sp. SCSIO 30461]|uniref:hypothetical protein n=1 Tax=Streptomyces sp. SCSIO 30461 TaxID=3118085 RepID=UPI0030D1380E
MGDTLLVLCIPLTVCASGIYAVCESWWRRRHPAPPSPYTHAAARLREREMLVDAEAIVTEAYSRLAPLYANCSTQKPENPEDRENPANSRPDSRAGEPDDVVSGQGSTAGHAP